MNTEVFDLQRTLERREAATKRIIDHLRTDSKQQAIALVCGHMSISRLEEIAKFWDERLSPEEIEAIAAAPDG